VLYDGDADGETSQEWMDCVVPLLIGWGQTLILGPIQPMGPDPPVLFLAAATDPRSSLQIKLASSESTVARGNTYLLNIIDFQLIVFTFVYANARKYSNSYESLPRSRKPLVFEYM
jgi:hypothetical protein